ncbi:plasmid stabilization system protein ParE [Cerasibacillus quisquiliarum]|uniref:Type II toxin-antitoxin system RelE/ParE family toxin n=1 Tax=Cerasibacillus quisquiliarum TaxID=227865 RepID=A0A511UZN0_9BACI|nr:hypothetical protein [Cerasibacillus quisquiliarum]MBB5147324.1 plasmid stabilization system protein ParE [Cerasibacillus quisquiliarum]GEN32107.1 hypothetical protein CQU01_23450 [Cerasibacillus quisquiliarum]
MKYRVVLTNQADADLRGVYEYIAFTLLESRTAARKSYIEFGKDAS